MKRFLYTLLLSCCAASALVACTTDPTQDLLPSTGAEGNAWVTFDFGDNSFDEINISTRATLTPSAENRVSNLFVLIFDGNGKRIYGRFFDNSNRKDTLTELGDSNADCWYVANNEADNAATSGTVRIYAPQISGGMLYVLSNIDADMVNISPEKLRFKVQTLDDLKALTATLNQKITERNGFFPMTGHADNITIAAGHYKISSGTTSLVRVELERIDAKVSVKIRVAKGYRDEETVNDVTTAHIIDEFVPLSWQVVNLPQTSYVLPHDTDASTEFFNTSENKFETRKPNTFKYTYKDESGVTHEATAENADEHGFSFYMLENRAKHKGSVKGNYHLRDKRIKNDDDGTYDTSTGKLWEYAPEEGTYLIIKGEVVMALDISNEGKNQQLSADVVYYIHLGDFAKNLDDYNVCRNTAYTYTITIYGVDKIQAEVQTKKQEDESGAMGHVYVAKEKIFTFDAHYGREIVAFDAAHLTDVDHLSWYVSTPFGREGRPNDINGVQVPSGLDYKWVHFIPNEIIKDPDTGKEIYNTKHHAPYDPAKAMNILEFSSYIKDQKRRFDNGEENDFRLMEDADWKKKYEENPNNFPSSNVYMRNKIYMTIFVDEFYYTADPVTGDIPEDGDLWKDFVNKPNRVMHILCDSDESADKDSRSTGSVITIRQRSIQTIYNTQKPELKTAWGCETVDETSDVLWYYSKDEKYNDAENAQKLMRYYNSTYHDIQPSYDGNNSDNNGLYNTAKIWGLTSNGVFDDTQSWDTYVDFDQEYALNTQYELLRYSCMTRNRDENGDGKINASEIKWYMASINQLASLYIGDQGLSPDAVLYSYDKKSAANEQDDKGAWKWRSHVVSSTAFNGGFPKILWAEEGLSVGEYNKSWKKGARLSVRCVRNLGMDPATEEEAKEKLSDEKNIESNIPEKAVKVTYPSGEVDANSVYKFDMTNLNPLSIRYYSSQELEPNDEHSIEARVYWGFETGRRSTGSYTYEQLYNLLRSGKSPCPDGYRVPNVREAALMGLHCSTEWQLNDDFGRVSTYYSHGLKGLESERYETACSSWFFCPTQTRLDDSGSRGVRCVKDVRP